MLLWLETGVMFHLRDLAQPAILSSAMLVFFRIYRLIQPALVADLLPGVTARQSWRHFKLVLAYIAVAVVVASLVLVAGLLLFRWTSPRDMAPQTATTMYVSLLVPKLPCDPTHQAIVDGAR